MGVVVTSNMLRQTASIFDTAAKPNLVCMSFVPAKLRDYIYVIHNTFLKFASKSPVNVLGKVMVFVQLGNLKVYIHIEAVYSLAVLLLIGTLLMDNFVK